MVPVVKSRSQRKPHGNHKFRATMYVTAYQYARDGMSDEQIGKALGTTGVAFRRWCCDDEVLEDALERGRNPERDQPGGTFPEYVYRHLSPHLRALWDRINECATLENGVERVEALLGNQGKRARQHLFIHALAQSCFNVSESMRRLNISRKTFDSWVHADHEFAELIDEMHWHKENFFESAFIGRVAAGDTMAIIHAAKTQLRGRGYNDRIEIEHSGTVRHEHAVAVTDLDLPLEVRVRVLEALRLKQAADRGDTPVIEAVAVAV